MVARGEANTIVADFLSEGVADLYVDYGSCSCSSLPQILARDADPAIACRALIGVAGERSELHYNPTDGAVALRLGFGSVRAGCRAQE